VEAYGKVDDLMDRGPSMSENNTVMAAGFLLYMLKVQCSGGCLTEVCGPVYEDTLDPALVAEFYATLRKMYWTSHGADGQLWRCPKGLDCKSIDRSAFNMDKFRLRKLKPINLDYYGIANLWPYVEDK